jgi:hypothetical protein
MLQEGVSAVGEVKAVTKLLDPTVLQFSMLVCPGAVSVVPTRDVVMIDSASCAKALMVALWLLMVASGSCGVESRCDSVAISTRSLSRTSAHCDSDLAATSRMSCMSTSIRVDAACAAMSFLLPKRISANVPRHNALNAV